VVGIGASAGGLEAFTDLLRHLPTDTGMAFVFVQHLDPRHRRNLAEILARSSGMPVADRQKRFRLANPAALKEFGLDREGAVDVEQFAASLEVLRPDGSLRPIEEGPPLRALKGEVVTNQEEIIRTPTSGELRYRQVSAAPVRDKAGQIIGSVSVVRDVTELKRAVEALRQSEEDLNRAQAVSHTGSWRLNVRQDVLAWSDECHRICGIRKGTPLTYERFLSVVHPDDRDYVDRKWKAALGGEPYDIEHRLLVGDTVKWVRQKAELEFDEKGELVGGFGTCQDITLLKQADEALRRLSQFPEENPHPVLRVAADGTLIYANEPARNWLHTLGWHADSPLPAPVLAVASQARGQSHAIGSEIGNSAGATIWLTVVQPRGEDYVNLYGRDVTERKRAEQALKRLNETLEQRVRERTAALAESETRFRTIFEEASDGIILADPETRTFHVANRAACDMLGYSEEQMRAMGIADIHTNEDLPQMAGTFERLVRGEFSLAKDIPLKRSDGTIRYADVNAFPLVLSGKQYLAGIFRDITEQKDLERKLSAAAMYEQQLIGQELHDGLAQQLLGLGLMARSLQMTLEDKNSPAAEIAGELVQLVKDAHDHVRAMIKGVRPVDVQAGGLLAALTDLAAATERPKRRRFRSRW
jgi:PAS domain S-box-containing protein